MAILDYRFPRRRSLEWTGWLRFVVVSLAVGTCAVAVMSWLIPESGVQSFSRLVEETCPRNLHAIHAAIQKYARDHDGALPDDLASLLADGYLSSPMFLVCPGSNDTVAPGDTRDEWANNVRAGSHCSYAYGGKGLRLGGASDVAIVWDHDDPHRGNGHLMLSLDGTINFVAAK
jgi:hypothetical protein